MYKTNINSKLALGYGSKYQLLRMLGYHRNEFNKIIAETLELDDSNIKWLDFLFNGPCDSELLNLDFIPELKDKWKEFWSCGKGGINWDAVGKTNDNCYIFLEAKANFDEIKSSIGGSEYSIQNNKKRIKEFMNKYHLNSNEDKWCKQYYQLANRLVITDFVNNNGIKAYFIYVFFENGYEYNAPNNKSISSIQWEKEIKREKEELGINNTEVDKMLNYCIINCNKK